MIEILVPTGTPRIVEHPLAQRPATASLSGLRIGLLDNGKHNAGLLVHTVGAHLRAQFATVELVEARKVATNPAPPDVMDRLRTCDAVVLAIAD